MLVAKFNGAREKTWCCASLVPAYNRDVWTLLKIA